MLLGLSKEYISLVPEGNGVTYLGKRKLLEYYLQSEVMLPYDEVRRKIEACLWCISVLGLFIVQSE